MEEGNAVPADWGLDWGGMEEGRGCPRIGTDLHGLAPALLSFRCSIQARFFDGRGGTRFPLIENGLGGMEEGRLPTDWQGFARIGACFAQLSLLNSGAVF